jgi:hypothetical protein
MRSGGSAVFRLVVLALGLALLASAGPAFALALVPAPDRGVADGAQILDASDRAAVADAIDGIASSTGARVAVLTLSDAAGEDPKAIAVRTVNAWQLGKRSALLLVVMNPHELYIQPGDDLASALDEPTASAICHDTIAPKMRSGASREAILAGVAGIQSAIRSGGGGHGLPWGMIMGAGLGLGALFGLIWLVRWLQMGPCEECGRRVHGVKRVVVQPGYQSEGRGERSFACACGHVTVVPFSIGMLQSSSSSDSSSSSWDSSSSSSPDSSSSSGSGGGGSDW